MIELDKAAGVGVQQAPQRALEGDALAPLEAAVGREDDKAQKGETFRDRATLGAVGLEAEPQVRELGDERRKPGTERPSFVGEEEHVVDVAQVATAAQPCPERVQEGPGRRVALHELVELVLISWRFRQSGRLLGLRCAPARNGKNYTPQRGIARSRG